MKVKKCKKSSAMAPLGHVLTGVFLILGLHVLPTLAAAQNAPKLTVAAAADLQFALNEMRADFEQQSGAELTVIYGASGNLFTQIENGAPYDVFLSADMDYPRKLVAHRLANGATLYRYAVGRLVLWAPKNNGLDLPKQGMNSLVQPWVTKIAIANPRHAPYGRAAVEALKQFKLYDKVSSKLVLGENARQAAQFVESGNAQVGFLPLSLVFTPEMKLKGEYFQVPIEAYPTIDQGAAVLAKARNRDLAEKFLAYLKRPETVQLLKKYGFVEPLNLAR